MSLSLVQNLHKTCGFHLIALLNAFLSQHAWDSHNFYIYMKNCSKNTCLYITQRKRKNTRKICTFSVDKIVFKSVSVCTALFKTNLLVGT